MSDPKNRIFRGFKISHQKIVLEVDVENQLLFGHTELTLNKISRQQPDQTSGPKNVSLNARQIQIKQCLVNGVDANFKLQNYLEQVVPATNSPFSSHRDMSTFSTFWKAGLVASDQGELAIDIPPHLASQFYEGGPPLIVTIHYSLQNPKGGVYFSLNNESYPNRSPHMFTNNQTDGVRMWLPCCDNLTERYTWEMEITTKVDYTVIASGELIEQVYNLDETKKTIFYSLSVPTPAHSINLAVGPFVIYPDQSLPSTITHFCLPGREKELSFTVSFTAQAYRFYEDYLGVSFPFGSYKQVFVDEPFTKYSASASMSIFSSSLLYDNTIIDQVFETRKLLSLSLAMQYFGNHLIARSWADYYLIYGIAGFLSNMFFKKLFGNNEYRYRLYKDIEWLFQNDNGASLPALYHDRYTHPSEVHSEFFQRKAPLVFHMIERRIREDEFKKVLAACFNGGEEPTPGERPKIDYDTLYLQTRKFFKIIKQITANDMRPLQSRWIEGRGVPLLHCGFWFNRKRHQTEIALRQIRSEERDRNNASITVRITELDGVYDHVVSLDDDLQEFDLPVRSRMRKRKKVRGAKVGQNDEEDDLPPVPSPIPGSQPTRKNDTPLLFIRIDPDLEFLYKTTFKQPEFMWINQLEDKDVISQCEALQNLRTFPTTAVITALTQLLNNPRVFYRVRMDSASVIAKLSTLETEWAGVEQLIKTFKTHFFDSEGSIMMPNDFKDLSLYFLQKAIPEALALVQTGDGRTPSDVLDFLLDLLKSNDNAGNIYEDSYYIASLINAVGQTRTSGPNDIDRINKQIRRYLNLDQLMPSYHNIVTTSCIKALAQLQLSKRMNKDVNFFKEYCKYGYFHEVRIAAVESLLLLEVYESSSFLLDLVEKDPNIRFRYTILSLMKTHCPNVIPPLISANTATTNNNNNANNNNNNANNNNNNNSSNNNNNNSSSSNNNNNNIINNNNSSNNTTTTPTANTPIPNTPVSSSTPAPLANTKSPFYNDLVLINRIWGMINSSASAFDCRLRLGLFNVFKKIWGMDVIPVVKAANVTILPKVKQKTAPNPPASTSTSTSTMANTTNTPSTTTTTTTATATATATKEPSTAPPSKVKIRFSGAEKSTTNPPLSNNNNTNTPPTSIVPPTINKSTPSPITTTTTTTTTTTMPTSTPPNKTTNTPTINDHKRKAPEPSPPTPTINQPQPQEESPIITIQQTAPTKIKIKTKLSSPPSNFTPISTPVSTPITHHTSVTTPSPQIHQNVTVVERPPPTQNTVIFSPPHFNATSSQIETQPTSETTTSKPHKEKKHRDKDREKDREKDKDKHKKHKKHKDKKHKDKDKDLQGSQGGITIDNTLIAPNTTTTTTTTPTPINTQNTPTVLPPVHIPQHTAHTPHHQPTVHIIQPTPPSASKPVVMKEEEEGGQKKLKLKLKIGNFAI